MSKSLNLDRRTLMQNTAIGLAALPFSGLISCTTLSRGTSLLSVGEGPLDLAEGLTQRVIDRKGNRLSDGYISPARPDGMACFANTDGQWVLMRNHEIDQDDIGTDDGIGAYELNSAPIDAYSQTSLGAVSRLVIDPETLSLVQSNVVLSGTRKNCAGGPTPMGWLSCEETVDKKGDHGFVFLCDVNATSLQAPKRIDAYGRFIHEAAGFDSTTGICYLTEDRGAACLYRFLPDSPSEPFTGRLQAMVIDNQPMFKTTKMHVDQRLRINWIDVPDPLAGVDVAPQCQAAGAAVIVNGEGCWFDQGRLVFTASKGGAVGKGQLFELKETDAYSELTLLAAADDSTQFHHPDNIVIAPDGSVFFAEDNKGDCLIQRLTATGDFEPIARNKERGEEIAGVCFSPNGKVLFANIQEPGITVAISGFDF